MRWLEAEHPGLVVTSLDLGESWGQKFGLVWAGPELLFPVVWVGRLCSIISHLPECRQAPLHLHASISMF